MKQETLLRHFTWQRVTLGILAVLVLCVVFYVYTGCLPTTTAWVFIQIHNIKPNMTEAEVNRRLGFNDLIHPVQEYSGPPWASRGSGNLPFGNQITFVWDKSVSPHRLKHLSYNGRITF